MTFKRKVRNLTGKELWISAHLLHFILKGAPHFSYFPVLSVLNRCHLSETSQLHCTGRLHRHAPLPFLHTPACTHTHTRSYTYIAIRPSALLESAIVFNHNPADPLWQSSQTHRYNINSNPPLFPPPSSVSSSCPLSLSLPPLSLIPVAPFPFCHYPTHRPPKKKKKNSLDMHSHSVAIHKSLNAPSVGRQRFCLSLKC